MRRAKIVCTLGPATSTLETIIKLVEVGMDVARLNLSHGTHDDHLETFNAVREASRLTGRAVAIMVDLQGPKIRLGVFNEGPVDLAPGDTFTITTRPVMGTQEICATTYDGLPGDVSPGDRILVDDGKVTLRALEVKDGTDVVTEVLEGGPVSNHKGINLPGVAVSVPAMTEKDINDLRWALRTGCDLVALSFVRRADDVSQVRQIMADEKCRLPVLAKIEKPQAVEDLDNIVRAFDGIMVARGDLGVELPLEEVPLVQKEIISKARELGKPVIVATQMLDSMIVNSRPTRAEVSDVANAVLDGADAVMLSGETSVGAHPLLVVDTMARIIERAEKDASARVLPFNADTVELTTARAITRAATVVANQVRAKYLCSFTETGLSARLLARHRPDVPILVFTPNERTRNQLALVWGVDSFIVDHVSHTDDMVRQVEDELLMRTLAALDDIVVVVAGVPPGVPGTTNGLRVHTLGRAGPAAGV